MKYRLFGMSDVGKVRSHNEDRFTLSTDPANSLWNLPNEEFVEPSESGILMIVADGMGGTQAGEVAAEIALRSVKKQFDELHKLPTEVDQILNLLKSFFLEAHNEIVVHQKQHSETTGMGTTLVVGWILEDVLYVVWCGDSRCYVFSEETSLRPLTEDHSLVWNLVRKNILTPEGARKHPNSNILTQHLGDRYTHPQPEGKVKRLRSQQRVLFCSDGLNGMLSDDQIHSILMEEKDTSQACRRLVSEANLAGGADNISVVLCDVTS